jgi:hypothetical protein
MQKNVWLKSSLSSGGDNCVEVRLGDNGVVSVRDSKLGDASPVLDFAPTEWVAFTRGAQLGEFDWG